MIDKAVIDSDRRHERQTVIDAMLDLGQDSDRRHVGFGARNGVRLSHKGKPFTAFVLTLILISGDISTNPGPRCLCKLCKKRVKDRGIQCDVCSKWLHPDCIGLDETEYIRLGESDETWLCSDCNEKDDLKKDFYSTLQAKINIRGLKVAHINCRGLLGKLTEITLILQETKIDILGITETHLSNKIKDEEIRIDGFNVQRLDRSNQRSKFEDTYCRVWGTTRVPPRPKGI